MTCSASHCVLFQKTSAVSPSGLYLSPMGEVIIISACLSAKIQVLIVSQTGRGQANIYCDNSLYLHDSEKCISCHCWIKKNWVVPPWNTGKSTERGHLIYRGAGHKSIMADAHIIHSISMSNITECLQLQNAQINIVKAHKYEQINNRHGRQTEHMLPHADHWYRI